MVSIKKTDLRKIKAVQDLLNSNITDIEKNSLREIVNYDLTGKAIHFPFYAIFNQTN